MPLMPITGSGSILRTSGHACNAGAASTGCGTIESHDVLIMTLKDDIEAASGDPAGLERLYRRLQTAGNEAEFREALRQCEEENPDETSSSKPGPADSTCQWNARG